MSASDPTPPPDGGAPAQGVPRKILIVDDDRAMLEHVSSMVTKSGHIPVVARTWGDALRLYREERPELVLLDVMMPAVDGYKLARMLKAEAQKTEGQGGGTFLPILLLTALDDDDSKTRGLNAGADDFLHKPVKQIDLEFRLSSMLRIKNLTDELTRLNTQLTQLAVTDPLTGLANRRSFHQVLDREWARSKRHGHPLGLLILDIDYFKSVNDLYGHPVGDLVLKLVSDVLRKTTRTTDVVVRYGGEEFAIIAPDTPPSHMTVFAERIRAAVAAQSNVAGQTTPGVTISIGGATTQLPGMASAEQLIQAADEAMYQAKHDGRNRVVIAMGDDSAAATGLVLHIADPPK